MADPVVFQETLSPAERECLTLACRHLALTAGKAASDGACDLLAAPQLQGIHATIDALTARVQQVCGVARALPHVPAELTCSPADYAFHHFGRFRREFDVETVAGDTTQPPLVSHPLQRS